MATVHRSARALLICVTGILLLSFLVAGMAAAFQEEPLAPLICPFPAAPSTFWGYVTLNSAPAPGGLKLAAWVNGVEVASTTTQAAGGSTYFLIDVPARAYDTVTGQLCRQGGAAGETVSFVLCSAITANETGIWNGGTQVQRDLTGKSCRSLIYLPLVMRR